MSLSRAQCRCLCCAVFVVLVTGSVLLGVSFSVLEPNEVGIEYNGNTLSVNSKELFTSGRHFLGKRPTNRCRCCGCRVRGCLLRALIIHATAIATVLPAAPPHVRGAPGVGHSFIVYPRTAQTVKFSPPPSNGPAIQVALPLPAPAARHC